MKRFYSIMATAMIGAFSYSVANAQSYTILQDLSSKIVNADFTADAAVTGIIRTYAKDMADNGIGAAEEPGIEMYGQQSITGWTALNLSDNIKNDPSAVSGDARAAGIFTYLSEEDEGTEARLGGDFFAPYDYEAAGNTGKALGMVAVWGATLQYTQDITLAPGAYMIVVPVINTKGAGSITQSLNGFITDDGVQYFSDRKSYAETNADNDTIVFKLTAETKGKLSIGYQSGNVGSGSSPHIFIDRVSLYQIDPATLDAAEVEAAKVDLLAVIEEGGQLGVETKDANIVYLNPNATLAEVLEAIEKQKAINAAGQVDLSEFFITNPHFNLDTVIEDGICTYEYDMEKNNVTHFGMQPITGWVATAESDNVWSGSSTDTNPLNGRACGVFEIGSKAFMGGTDFMPPMVMSDGSNEGRVLGFLTCWSKTTQYTQAVTIPAGKYTLTISYYNQAGTDNVAKNLMGFIADDGTEYLSDVTSFEIGSWKQMKIMFTLDEPTSGQFSVGYAAANVGSAKMPHFFIDGISINYVGDINFDPSLMALQASVSSATKLLDEKIYGELKDQLNEAITAGANLVSSQSADADANKAAADAINDLLPAVHANIAAYEKLQEFADGALADALASYEDIESLYGRLEELNDEVTLEALEECTWSTEQIEKAIASLDTMIKEEVKKVWDSVVESGKPLDKDLDITKLLEGVAYTYNATALQGTNVPDKEWAYGDASNFKTQFGTAEVWNQSPFKVTRTMADMPAGTYTIKTRAFYRTADQISNYDAYINGDTEAKAFVWAGHAKAPIANIALLATSDQSAFAATSAVADETLYVPNNQQSAHDIFENPAYGEIVETTVKTVLPTAGDLNFGVCADELMENSWVVWYGFEISYNALDDELLDTELEGLIAEANEMVGNVETNVKAVSNLDAATAKGDKALSSKSTDDKIAAATELNAALDYANKAVELATKIENVVMEYTTLIDESSISSTDQKFLALYDEASAGSFESNEKIEQIIADLPAAWVGYVLAQEGLDQASEENPIDVTGVILNAAFNSGNANYWTIAPEEEGGENIGQNQGYQSNNEYVDDETGIVISQFIETWRSNGVKLNNGTVSQEIVAALPAGYYVLEADAYAVNQTAVPEEGTSGAYLMAQNALGTFTQSICVDETGAKPTHFAVEFQSDGTSLTKVGLLVKDTNASWMAADNFTLKYVGKAPSTGILSDIFEAIMAKIVGIYSVDGKKQSKLTKGINIIKMSDGTVQKLMVE